MIPLEKLLSRKSDSYKYDFGKCLMFTGQFEMIGASLLAGKAAQKMGVGLLTFGVPKIEDPGIYFSQSGNVLTAILHLNNLEATTLKYEHAQKKIPDYDCISFGFGFGETLASKSMQIKILKTLIMTENKKNILIDGSALNNIARYKKLNALFDNLLKTDHNIVITPHLGEAKTLFKENDIKKIEQKIKNFVKSKPNLFVALKSHKTKIFYGNEVESVGKPCPALATAGSGDVLAGIISGLLTRGIEPKKAVSLGVEFHNKLGGIAQKKYGQNSCSASDLIDCIKI